MGRRCVGATEHSKRPAFCKDRPTAGIWNNLSTRALLSLREACLGDGASARTKLPEVTPKSASCCKEKMLFTPTASQRSDARFFAQSRDASTRRDAGSQAISNDTDYIHADWQELKFRRTQILHHSLLPGTVSELGIPGCSRDESFHPVLPLVDDRFKQVDGFVDFELSQRRSVKRSFHRHEDLLERGVRDVSRGRN